MALPKINKQAHSVMLPGLKKRVKFRPFTVKEFKILMAAKESKKVEDQIRSVEQIVNNCVLEDNFDPREMYMFDAEKLFLAITAKSRGEEQTIRYKYTDANGVEKPVDVTVNLEDVDVVIPDDVTFDIKLDESLSLRLCYPKFGSLYELDENSTEFDQLKAIIDFVYDDESVYYLKDQTDEEIADFIDDFGSDTIEAIKDFLKKIPRLEHTVEIDLPDGKKDKITFRGLSDFFG